MCEVNRDNNHSPTSPIRNLIHATPEPFQFIGPASASVPRRRPLYRPPPMMPIHEDVPPAPREPRPSPPTFPPAFPPLITRNGRPVTPIPIHPRMISTGFLCRDDLPNPRITRTGTVHPQLPLDPAEPSSLRTTADGIRLEITQTSMQMRINPETTIPRPIVPKPRPPMRPTNPCRGCPRCRGPPELDPEA